MCQKFGVSPHFNPLEMEPKRARPHKNRSRSAPNILFPQRSAISNFLKNGSFVKVDTHLLPGGFSPLSTFWTCQGHCQIRAGRDAQSHE